LSVDYMGFVNQILYDYAETTYQQLFDNSLWSW